MCVIIHKPKGVAVEKSKWVEWLKNGWSGNNDGAGIAVISGGVVKFEKGFMGKDALLKRISNIRTDDDVIVHMRISTAGGVSAPLTHPFLISEKRSHRLIRGQLQNNESLLFHNGIARVSTPKGESDTSFIAKSLTLYAGKMSQPETQKFIELIADAMGKVIMVVHEGGFINIYRYGTTWQVRDDVHFSNSSCFYGSFRGTYQGRAYNYEYAGGYWCNKANNFKHSNSGYVTPLPATNKQSSHEDTEFDDDINSTPVSISDEEFEALAKKHDDNDDPLIVRAVPRNAKRWVLSKEGVLVEKK